MVSIDPPEYKITSAIRQLEASLKETRWWEFTKRRRIASDLADMKNEAFEMGIELAMQELKSIGFLK